MYVKLNWLNFIIFVFCFYIVRQDKVSAFCLLRTSPQIRCYGSEWSLFPINDMTNEIKLSLYTYYWSVGKILISYVKTLFQIKICEITDLKLEICEITNLHFLIASLLLNCHISKSTSFIFPDFKLMVNYGYELNNIWLRIKTE